MALFVGASMFWQEVETGDSNTSSVGGIAIDSLFQWSVDASWEWNGWNAFAALVGRNTEASGNPAAAAATNNHESSYGLVLQGGYMLIPDKFEPYVRYEMLDLTYTGAGVVGGTTDDVHIVTVGANYYLNKHNAKFTADVVWALEPLNTNNVGGAFAGNGGVNNNANGGLLSDFANEDNQVSLRAQLQLMF